LARKFLGIIYRTLKNKWMFEDFPNFVTGGGSDGMSTAACASAQPASLQLQRLIGRCRRGKPNPRLRTSE
jgi:hypothetical protein